MQEVSYKTRPDGSIDTAYYVAKGRFERSVAAHDLVAKAANAPGEATASATNGLFAWFLVQIAPLLFRRRGAN